MIHCRWASRILQDIDFHQPRCSLRFAFHKTTLTYFKGPAAQKSFLTSHGAENLSENTFASYEVVRSIFALTNTNTAPPITTDVEYIWKFDKVDDNTVQAKLRIAEYLNAQSDVLYFDARQRAVSLQDYELDLKRVDQ